MAQDERTPTSDLPDGWTESRIRAIIDHYDSQTDEEAVAEDEAAFQRDDHTVMVVPSELVPVVQALLAEFARHSMD